MYYRYLILCSFCLLSFWFRCEAFEPPANGHYKELYSNGKTREKGYFLKGVKHKIWQYYDENGRILKKEKWQAGELQWQIFYKNGRISRTIDKDGKEQVRPACGC